MKTKNLIISICMLMGVMVSQVFAQEKDKKTEQGWFESGYYTPVFCGDEMTDYLWPGTVRIHYVKHDKDRDGIVDWEIDQMKGEAESYFTGEVFKVKEIDRTDNSTYLAWRYNLIGNNSSHYIGTLTLIFATGELIVGKTVCH